MNPPVDADDPGADSFHIDLLRGELYRILDELVRAHGEHYLGLVVQFEETWHQLKAAKAASRGSSSSSCSQGWTS